MRIGNYDVGPLVDKGQKHWTTVGPIVTPIAIQMARKVSSPATQTDSMCSY